MTHWAEGQARTDLRDDLGTARAKGVRAFVAIRMNEQVEDSVAKTIDELKHPHDGVRWVPRANLHITLKFLGPAVDSHRLQQLTADFISSRPGRRRSRSPRMESARSPTSSIHARFGWACIASIGRARGSRGALGDCRGRVRIRAREAAMERASDDRPGRRRPIADKTRDALRARRDREFGVSKIESITLYRSHLGPDARQLRSARDIPVPAALAASDSR